MYTSMRLTPASGVTRHFRIWERGGGGKGQLSTNEVWRHAPYIRCDSEAISWTGELVQQEYLINTEHWHGRNFVHVITSLCRWLGPW